MKVLKLITLIVAGIGISATAYARTENLQVSNFTDYKLSFKVNGNCSEVLNTVFQYTIKKYSDKTFKEVCQENNAPCRMEVYGAEHCEGKRLSRINFYSNKNFVESYQEAQDINTGVTNHSSGYDIFFSR